VTKLLLILIFGGVVAKGLEPSQPPMLIDSAPAAPTVSIDVAD
jgi:hypothetical protein